MRIKTEYVTIQKRDLIKNRLLVAIDSGTSLTKLLFLNKKSREEFLNDNTTSLILEFHLYPNDDFEEAIEFVKLNALQLEEGDYRIHITGEYALKNRDQIQRILNKKTVFIDKKVAVTTGFTIAQEHIGFENMLAPNVQDENFGIFDSEMIKKFAESIGAKFKTNNSLLADVSSPSIFSLNGTNMSCLCLNDNGTSEYYGLPNRNGKTFLGLAKCLLDTNEYNEVVDLASRGDLSNVDTLIKEVLDGSVDSPYGKFPPELPIFSFGKCADYNLGLSDLKQEDVAISLVSLFSRDIAAYCTLVCGIKKIPKTYIMGNMLNTDLFQKEFQKYMSFFPSIFEFIFLNFGYCGALGAMFSDGNVVPVS